MPGFYKGPGGKTASVVDGKIKYNGPLSKAIEAKKGKQKSIDMKPFMESHAKEAWEKGFNIFDLVTHIGGKEIKK
jgi:hypothetical protein